MKIEPEHVNKVCETPSCRCIKLSLTYASYRSFLRSTLFQTASLGSSPWVVWRLFLTTQSSRNHSSHWRNDINVI